jgi:hypothetical protein
MEEAKHTGGEVDDCSSWHNPLTVPIALRASKKYLK